MTGEIHVAGTRTFAAEMIDWAQAAGLHVAGLVEPSDRTRVGQVIHELPVTWLDAGPGAGDGAVLVGTGQSARREIVARLIRAGWRPVRLIHPLAQVSARSTVDEGAIVGPGAIIGACSTLGPHVVVNRGTLIGHHTQVREFATLGPGVNVAGNVRVDADAFLGMAAVVRDHVTVGACSVVAAGAVIVRDVPAGVQVRGVPATVQEGPRPALDQPPEIGRQATHEPGSDASERS
jgi:acetyltransferase EpsM